MPRKIFCILTLLLVGLLGAPDVAYAAERADATITVDWTKAGDPINRRIFSTQGFMQIYVEPNPLVMESFTLINPRGTSTRLETYIHRMEPENDNDDPNVFDWSRFRPDKMIRFIDDRKAFEKVAYDTLGMEPLSLLCYSVSWLQGKGPEQIVTNHDEWVEFAAAVVQSCNGKKGDGYKPDLQYVEVWNEPNFAEFSIGGIESYFTLFEKTADRIHRDYPGVMVAGPAISHAPTGDPERWMDAFLKECADKADVLSWHHYGPQGEPVDRLINDLTDRVGRFRKIPGKEKGQAMITEIDAWFHGWPKMQHILERQFRFMEHSDLLHSVHHFCCMAYNPQGNYTFGVICDQGAVMPGVFWPYWLFRNLIGNESQVEKQGRGAKSLRLLASSFAENGQSLSTAVLHNSWDKAQKVHASLTFAESSKPRVLVLDRVSETFQGPDEAWEIPAGSYTFEVDLRLKAGEAASLTLQEPGKRFFAFRDMDNQEYPWVGLACRKSELRYHESADLAVRVMNLNPEAVSGTIEIRGIPADWKVERVKGNADVKGLGFGKVQSCTYRITVTSAEVDHVSPYAVLVTPETASLPVEKQAHSIPVLLQVEPPIHVHVLPVPVSVVPGEENAVMIQVSNTTGEAITGQFEFVPPKGYTPVDVPEGFELPSGSQKRYSFGFAVPGNAPQGAEKGSITLRNGQFSVTADFQVRVMAGIGYGSATPIDLARHYNLDPVSFNEKKSAYDSGAVGSFAFPGDYLPSDCVVRACGIPFRFGKLDGKRKTVVEPRGQMIPVEPGNYRGVSFVGFGHDGKHPGTWTFHYSDGTTQRVASEIPEWCTPAPAGYVEVFHAPYRYMQKETAPPACQLYLWTIDVDPAKTLTGIELPKMDNAYLFAMTVLASDS